MPDNIAGYIDRNYVKGQTYRLAGCPVPAVFTGNIDEISEDLLVKAMFVANDGSAAGTFPQEVGGQYLMNTIKYGNDMYLQTAYLLSSKMIEYNRIYANNEWSKWMTSDAGDVAQKVSDCETRLNGIYDASKTPATGFLPDLTKDVRKLDRVDPANPANNGRVTNLENSISGIRTSINNKIQQVTITQNVKMSTVGESFGKFQLGTELVYPTNGVLIGMRVNTTHPGNIVGVVYMLTYASNGTKPYINYQKGPNVTFNESHDFIFTFYTP